MKGLISINWNGSPVSSPVTISSHCGEFNKESMYGLIHYLSTWTKKKGGCGEMTISRGVTIIILLLHFVQ